MPTVAAPTFPFTRRFKEWRALKSQNDMVAKRLDDLRKGTDGQSGMLAAIKEYGEEIEGGHFIWTFPQPVEYSEGRKTQVYEGLKAERRLIPSAPTPDPESAEDMLRDKGLWMTEDQEKMLEALRLSCPNVIFTAEPDTDAFSALYLKKVITEKEYESTLVEQREQWAFVPQEIK